MFKSRWWVDLRYEQERKMAVGIAIALFVSAIFVSIIAYETYMRLQEEDSLGLSLYSGMSSPLPQATPIPPKGLIEDAGEFIKNGKFDEAEKLIRQAEVQTFRLKGRIAQKNGDLPAATANFEAALKVDPDSPIDLANLACAEILAGKHAVAVERLKRAATLEPTNLFIANRLLLARYQAGDVAGVRSDIETALATSPENSLHRVAITGAALELAAGQFANAANFLYAAKARLPASVFERLIAEPPIAMYASNKALVPFFTTLTDFSSPAAKPAATRDY
jgi:tetratricopeptide (TPR) repeat protein